MRSKLTVPWGVLEDSNAAEHDVHVGQSVLQRAARTRYPLNISERYFHTEIGIQV